MPVQEQNSSSENPVMDRKKHLSLVQELVLPRGDLAEETHFRKRRFMAFFFDFFLLHGVSLGLASLISWTAVWASVSFGSLHAFSSVENVYRLQFFLFLALWAAVLFPLSLAYYVGSIHFFGRSMGHSLLGLRVVNESGETPNFFEATLRFVFFLVSWFGLGLDFILNLSAKDDRFFFERLSRTKTIVE